MFFSFFWGGEHEKQKLPSYPFLVVAFLVAYNQNKQLVGDTGLLPLKLHMEAISKQ